MEYMLLIFFAFWGQHLYLQTHELDITITGLKNTEGIIQIGLYNKKESFPLIDGQYKLFYIDAKDFSGIYTIKDLPEGEYAIAIFHDKNSDKVGNTNLLSILKEGFGFSKNFKPRLSSPSFNDCKIDLNSNMSITIRLIYR